MYHTADLTREQQRCITRGTTENDTAHTVQDLIAYPTELPWLEFKESWFEPHALGEYVSALSNAAALAGRDCFAFQDNAIVVTIPFQRIDAQAVDKAVDKVSNQPGLKPGLKLGHMNEQSALSDKQRRIVEALRDNPNITQRQLMKSLGLARSTIQEAMVRLREMGYIERVGSRKTGWWRVLK